MNVLEPIRSSKMGQKVAAVSATAGTLTAMVAASPLGNVTAHFGLSYKEAAQIVAAVATGGIAIDFLFPWLLPAVGTIQAIIAAAGTGAAIGW